MASPFDISTYETALSAKDAVNPEVLARANRAARVAKFGEAAVGRMETAGRLFGGGAAPSAAAPAVAPVAAEAAPLTRFARLRALLNPAITGRGIARVARGVGKFGAIGGVAGGAVQSLTDTPESVAALGESVGLDTGTTPGRIGANVVNVAKNIGDYASFGIAPRVGRMLTGGSFFDPAAPAAAPAVAAPVTDQGLPIGPQSPIANIGATPGVSRVTTPERAAAARAALEGPYTGDLPVGTGFIRNNATGETREFRGGGATPTVSQHPGFTRGGHVRIDASGMRARRDAAAATAALAAKGAYLRGEAAFMKAEEGNNKPENTTVVPGLPGQAAEIYQVNRGVAKKLPVLQPFPVGKTATMLQNEYAAAIKRSPGDKNAALAKLRSFGLEPL